MMAMAFLNKINLPLHKLEIAHVPCLVIFLTFELNTNFERLISAPFSSN